MLYIMHRDEQEPSNGIAYFGPFAPEEIGARLNDAYADMLAQSGPVYEVELSNRNASRIYINPASYWKQQLSELTGEPEQLTLFSSRDLHGS